MKKTSRKGRVCFNHLGGKLMKLHSKDYLILAFIKILIMGIPIKIQSRVYKIIVKSGENYGK